MVAAEPPAFQDWHGPWESETVIARICERLEPKFPGAYRATGNRTKPSRTAVARRQPRQ
jgi:hypothetical protein